MYNKYILFIILFITSSIYCANIVTNCSNQLHNFYQVLGMNASFPLIEPINFTSGGTNLSYYVDVTVGFQKIANIYQSAIPGLDTNVNTSIVNYLSIDLPWCYSDIVVSCADKVITGIGKLTNCAIKDYPATGVPTDLAGRMFIYANQTTACDGIVTIRFYNVTIRTEYDAVYTYNTEGLPLRFIDLTSSQSTTSYQKSECNYSDGTDYDESIGQEQFVCISQRVGCDGTTTYSAGNTLAFLPTPLYSCIGDIDPNDNTTQSNIVWRIISFQPPSGVTGRFKIFFCQDLDFSCELLTETELQPGNTPYHDLLPGTRRQFNTSFANFDHYALLYYSDKLVNFQPVYLQAPRDEVLRIIPCICGFSMDCDDSGKMDSSIVSGVMNLDNILPLPDAGQSFTIPIGQTNIKLFGNKTNDPDNSPGPLSTYWKVYSKPVGSNPVIISDPQLLNIVIDSTDFSLGLYSFVIYASDTQDITFAFVNITVINNIIHIVMPYDFEYKFEPYYGIGPDNITDSTYCPQTVNEYPFPSIILNASLTWSTNPNVTLYYQWTQKIGYPVTVYPYTCSEDFTFHTAALINSTQKIAFFVPPNIGLYIFELRVTDGINTEYKQLQIFVVPDFLQPVGPPLILPNYTNAPIRNLTNPARPILNFSNLTFTYQPLPPTTLYNDTNGSSGSNNSVGYLFPTYDKPMTFYEQIVMLLAIICIIMVLTVFLAYYLIEQPMDDVNFLARIEMPTNTF